MQACSRDSSDSSTSATMDSARQVASSGDDTKPFARMMVASRTSSFASGLLVDDEVEFCLDFLRFPMAFSFVSRLMDGVFSFACGRGCYFLFFLDFRYLELASFAMAWERKRGRCCLKGAEKRSCVDARGNIIQPTQPAFSFGLTVQDCSWRLPVVHSGDSLAHLLTYRICLGSWKELGTYSYVPDIVVG